ncbi:hypothetical protein K469DRAFT_747315 [Zopfia rhizophila CBS 207.26]|uniref:Uncharacterized protein n=1 Tax=Zopfia rhizophila CBS 207.26 TaxID=1314779 RepID=A0A6A6EHH2_9PEZI|nr:hypothetical protein K469DRAFT_747315 [Zopfia rhizophila CBS 207.26]
MFLIHHFSSLLLLASIAVAVPVECTVKEGTVYTAWSRPRKPLPEGEKPSNRGLNQPFRQNGTWMDVGVWEYREDIISQKPFLFTLGPGRDDKTHTIVPVADTTKNLAYSEGDLTLDVNYGSLAAWILTVKGNGKTQVVDDWTVQEDEFGRLLLGLGRIKPSPENEWGVSGGNDWTMGGCAWNDPKGNLCDGFYFYGCAGCFGTPAVVEVVEWKEGS